jgi:phosphate acyltransferase
MRIALDAMGGDFAPDVNIEGAISAINELPEEVSLHLIGPSDLLQSRINTSEFGGRIKIIHAEDVIGMGEHPTKAFSQKQKSSIAIGYALLKAKEVDVFCSAGNTGAMLVGAMFTIRAVEGIIRPAIASFVPRENGDYGIILDVGANAEVKPDVLVQFGELGSLYARHVMKIENPKVGLMNLGEEEQKGTLLTQAAYQLFRLNNKVNFIGNIEGKDVFNDKADVIVCDGFVGNVILKQAESIYDLLKERNISDPFFERFNYESVGGSPILGVNGNIIIGHGVSSALAIKNMIHQAKKMAESEIHTIIKKAYDE